MLVIDAHHHFWDPARASYPWMTDEVAAIRHPFGPDDLRPLLSANGVHYTVLVQARSSIAETRELLALAARLEFVAGVIGWVDLTASDVARRVAELRSGPGGNKLVGIRHQVHDEPDAEWLLRGDVRRGIRAVGEANMVYELLVRTRELPAAFALARELPDMRFVIDHLAKPPIATGAIDGWSERLAPFGALPHVLCKISGMVTEADRRTWTVAQLRPYVRRALAVFGARRLVFGSDWPVCLLAASYSRVMDAARGALGEISEADSARIFGGNAIALYRLAIPAAAAGAS